VSEMKLTLEERDVPGRHFVEIRSGGRVVSRGNVLGVPTRIGGAVVRLGGIGGIFTTPALRRRGLNRRVMDRLVAWMTEQQFELSALWGIDDYYHRFGYVPCMPGDTVFVVDAGTPLKTDGALRMRRMRRSDAPAMVRLYSAQTAGFTGAAVRERGRWRGFRHGRRYHHQPDAVTVAVDGSGRVAGYCARERIKDELVVCESIGRDPACCRALLAHLTRVARRNGLRRVALHLPLDAMMADLCRTLTCTVRTGFRRNGGGMARIIDQPALLGTLAPEFTRRLAGPNRLKWTGRLRVRTELGTDDLVVRRGAVTRSEPSGRADAWLRLSGQALTQLVYGFRGAESVLVEQRPRPGRTARELAAALFPRTWAYTWWPDRY